jgi:hypothetical protein
MTIRSQGTERSTSYAEDLLFRLVLIEEQHSKTFVYKKRTLKECYAPIYYSFISNSYVARSF